MAYGIRLMIYGLVYVQWLESVSAERWFYRKNDVEPSKLHSVYSVTFVFVRHEAKPYNYINRNRYIDQFTFIGYFFIFQLSIFEIFYRYFHSYVSVL